MDHHTAIVIGAGISGLVALKTLRQKNIDCILYEATEYNGGLWHYSLDNYGVMECTHINVTKYNYAFSDFPFPDDAPDFVHHSQMAEYIDRYVERNGLYNHIHYRTRVVSTTRSTTEDGKNKWILVCDSKSKGQEISVSCDYLVVATGHHAQPKIPDFPGQQNFAGTIIHSVDYKDVITNGFQGKNVVIVGIGNSAVDAAVNCVAKGGCNKVYISSRSGAWVVPNYLFGIPIDLYASRNFFYGSPFWLTQKIMEFLICLVSGHPTRWNLNPKMKALQTQPTVSPTLIHHIQRGNIQVVPNIREIMESSVRFFDGTVAEDIDVIVNCTGYLVDLPFLPEKINNLVLNSKSNEMKLYKSVFSPDIGPQLAFIGFVQPASGGILPMSEVQSQWLAMLIKGRCSLPSIGEMKFDMQAVKDECRMRYYQSSRHTMQHDPIKYNDEVAGMFGAKPELSKHFTLAHRLWFGSGGVAQWTLQGPFANEQSARLVKKVPIPPFSIYFTLFMLFLVLYGLQWFFSIIF